MNTHTVKPLESHLFAHVEEFCPNPKLANIRVTVMQKSYGEEGVFYPAQDVVIYGKAIAELRSLLNSLPES